MVGPAPPHLAFTTGTHGGIFLPAYPLVTAHGTGEMMQPLDIPEGTAALRADFGHIVD